ncbi:hypothetical protein [Leptospira alstonii]|uniref:hypothetical protein n=1 Tax=Leptospira alstonii TaxID=28452 RepID=UPI001F40E40D|nr:hypothetical protein [Leptospira alstonii]
MGRKFKGKNRADSDKPILAKLERISSLFHPKFCEKVGTPVRVNKKSRKRDHCRCGRHGEE